MPLSELRTHEIATAYLQRQARHSRHPRQITAQEARRLQTWLVVFWLNQDIQTRLSKYLRIRGDRSGRRRSELRNFLVGRDQETDKYEVEALQVGPSLRTVSYIDAEGNGVLLVSRKVAHSGACPRYVKKARTRQLCFQARRPRYPRSQPGPLVQGELYEMDRPYHLH